MLGVFLWPEYRDSNQRPLEPEISYDQKSNFNRSIWYDYVHIQRF